MANYNFTFLDGELTYKDADGNTCSVGGSAIYNIPIDANMLPAASYNTIKQNFENGNICLISANERTKMVIAIGRNNEFYNVMAADIVFVNTDPDATSGWDIE